MKGNVNPTSAVQCCLFQTTDGHLFNDDLKPVTESVILMLTGSPFPIQLWNLKGTKSVVLLLLA